MNTVATAATAQATAATAAWRAAKAKESNPIYSSDYKYAWSQMHEAGLSDTSIGMAVELMHTEEIAFNVDGYTFEYVDEEDMGDVFVEWGNHIYNITRVA